jgi:hypothetical protein
MSPLTSPRTPLRTALRGRIEHARASRATRKALEHEIADYTTESHRNDLHAMLDRYPEAQTAEIRRILARHAA